MSYINGPNLQRESRQSDGDFYAITLRDNKVNNKLWRSQKYTTMANKANYIQSANEKFGRVYKR
jgi:hypothetical protein